jgi:hypothetical protein
MRHVVRQSPVALACGLLLASFWGLSGCGLVDKITGSKNVKVQTFSATPNPVQAGTPVLLRWDVQGADAIQISPGVGSVPAKGSREVTPTATTSYSLAAKLGNATTVTRVEVVVNVPTVVTPTPTPGATPTPTPVPTPTPTPTGTATPTPTPTPTPSPTPTPKPTPTPTPTPVPTPTPKPTPTPVPTPTPPPTPTPVGGAGALWLQRNTWVFDANTWNVSWPLDRKDGTHGRVTADWHATCVTPGADCPNASGTFVFADGQNEALASFTAPAQSLPGNRYWHFTLSNPTGGVRLDDTGGNIEMWANDSSLNWLVPTFPATRGNSVGMWVTRGGDLSYDQVVYFWVDDPSGSCVNTDGLRHGQTANVTIPAGQTAKSLGGWVKVYPGAPVGCTAVLHFADGTVTGRTPTCVVTAY